MSNPTPSFTFEDTTVPVVPSEALANNPFVAPVTDLKTTPKDAEGKPRAKSFTVPGTNDRKEATAYKSAYHQLMQAGKACGVTVKVSTKVTNTPAKGKAPASATTTVTFWAVKRITRNRTAGATDTPAA